jgi:pentatricopeptide repeat protein
MRVGQLQRLSSVVGRSNTAAVAAWTRSYSEVAWRRGRVKSADFKEPRPTLYKGLTPEALEFTAITDEEHAAGESSLGARPGRKVMIAPLLEKPVWSHQEHMSHTGREGEIREVHPLTSIEGDKQTDQRLRIENKVKRVMLSNLSRKQKADLLLEVSTDVQQQGLPLSAASFTDIFLTWAIASEEQEQAAIQQRLLPPGDSVEGGKGDRLGAGEENPGSDSSLGAGPFQLQLNGGTVSYLEAMMNFYMYMRGTFTAPSAATLEYVMQTLSRVKEPNERIAHFAIRLIGDGDKFTVLPSTLTYAAFFRVCDVNGCMSLAVSKFSDAVKELHVIADTPMCEALLTGLNRHGMIEEAIAFIGRMKGVMLDTKLANAMMNTFLLSSDPQTVFSSYESTFRGGLLPDCSTYDILLLACERTGHWEESLYVLREMQRYGIKGSPATLNLLLKGLMKLKDKKEFVEQLYLSMKAKGIAVWPTLESHLPIRLQEQGHQLTEACAMQSRETRRAVLHQVRAGRLNFPTSPQAAKTESTPNPAAASSESTADGEGTNDADEGGASEGAEAGSAGTSVAGSEEKKKNKRYFAVPENIDQLKDFARRKKLKSVDPEYLRQFLYAEGVPLDKRGDHLSHGQLAREVHKLLYGVYPVSVAPIVSGYQRRPRPHFGSERKRRR